MDRQPGLSTTESYVKFGAILQSPGTSTLQLQIEVQPAGTSFTNTPNTTSSFVATGTDATAVFGTSTDTYPRAPESSSNGSFHWQARVKDSNGATSTWQMFGATTSSTDFVINTVPEYMQKFGPWPSTSNATDAGTGWWHNDTYADGSFTCGGGNTIGFCGCAITTVSMWLRAYGITIDGDGHDINPGRLNAWLTSHSGYDPITGALNWTAIENYASSTSGVITFDTDAFNATSGFDSYVNSNLSSSTPNPVILREDDNDHFVLATGFAHNAGTSTYTVRDSAWYDTQYLNQATSTDTSSTVYGYRNNIDAVRVYYDPPTLPLQSEYHVNLPNGIMLVDSQGRRTGKNPATGIRYHEIPGTAYGEDCLSKTNCAGELLTTDLPDGNYVLYVLGSTRNFGLSVYNNRGLSQVFRGELQPGTMAAYSQGYKAAAFESSAFSLSGTVSSTASVTIEPPHNLPPPLVPQPLIPKPAPVFTPIEAALVPPPRPATSSISLSSSSVSTSSLTQ